MLTVNEVSTTLLETANMKQRSSSSYTEQVLMMKSGSYRDRARHEIDIMIKAITLIIWKSITSLCLEFDRCNAHKQEDYQNNNPAKEDDVLFSFSEFLVLKHLN